MAPVRARLFNAVSLTNGHIHPLCTYSWCPTGPPFRSGRPPQCARDRPSRTQPGRSVRHVWAQVHDQNCLHGCKANGVCCFVTVCLAASPSRLACICSGFWLAVEREVPVLDAVLWRLWSTLAISSGRPNANLNFIRDISGYIVTAADYEFSPFRLHVFNPFMRNL